MTRDDWGRLSDQQKLDYLFNWSERLDVGIQLLEARLKISTDSGESAS